MLGLGVSIVATRLAADTAGDCRPLFVTPATYEATGAPIDLDAADLDGDGRDDLVVTTDNIDAALSVRLGNPGGTLGPPLTSNPGLAVRQAVLGTFDADSDIDVVVADFGSLAFAAGNGNGTFASALPIPGDDLLKLAAGDFDGDGELDLVGWQFVFGNEPGLQVRLGNGDGTFQSAVHTSAPGPPASLAVGNLDAGGDMDVVLASESDLLSIYLGDGNGGFTAAGTVTLEGELSGLTLADLDSDGDLDLIVAADHEVRVLLGNGNATFELPISYSAGEHPRLFQVGDFDGDGVVDIAVDNAFGGYLPVFSTLWLLHGNGDGTFTVSPDTYLNDSYEPSPGGPTFVAGDFGGDGRLDVASSNVPQDGVTVLTGNGDGTFQGVRAFELQTPPGFGIGSGDFDEDGLPDLAAGYPQPIQVLLNAGDGRFSRGASYFFGLSGGPILTPDLNGDGHLDLVTRGNGGTPDGVFTMLGNGDGTFQPPDFVEFPSAEGLATLASADFDADGFPDLVMSDVSDLGGRIYVRLNQGDGTFEDPIPTDIIYQGWNLIASDFNGDGEADIAMTAQNFQKLIVLIGAGDGTFADPIPYPIPSQALPLAAADLRHSGHPDIVVATSGGVLMVFPANGDGTFGEPDLLGVGFAVLQISFGDANGDGHTDLITIGERSVIVLLGLGNGAFQSPQIYLVGAPIEIAPADWDGNGTLDLVFNNSDSVSGGLTLLQNAGLGAAVPGATVLVGTPAVLEARAAGTGTLAYQWRKDGAELTDGGPVSGATTATLTIDPATFSDAGTYDVVVTDACGELISAPGILSVEFADVPVSSPFHDDILTIATASVTGGCGGSNYCPANPVRRDQMAVFLLKSEHGSAYEPPPCTPGLFSDVACPGPFADWIQQLAAEGITAGCGPGVYCPSQPVTRGQMSVFLLKTKEGPAYAPPAATGLFGDVPPGAFAAAFIEELYHRGITGGCSAAPLLYCPDSSVLRQQMATFLVRTFFTP